MKIGKYSFSLASNMDESPAFFVMAPSKHISKNSERVCVVRFLRIEKKHLMVVLPAKAFGQMLPSMIIFEEKTEQTSRNVNIPPGFIVKTQNKAWVDDDLMKVWVE